MKRKLLALLSCLVCLLLCAATLVASAQGTQHASHAQEVADGILAFEQGDVASVQEWIDTSLAAKAGNGAEWYILCLAQSGDYDFTAYEQALLAYLDQNTVPSATTKQKYALILSAIGSTDAYVSEVLDSTIGSLGIMSYAYGLHLLNNGYQSTSHTKAEVIDTILSLQKEDGGWAIAGKVSDVDATAMTLQALAPCLGTREDVDSAVEAALSLLADRQTEGGGFISYGVENPESAAQVIIALCALDVDPCTDARFIKNGNTLFDAIAQFALADGGFCHVAGSAYSASATAQVLCAMVAYLRFVNGQAPLYDLDHARPDQVQSAPQESDSAPASDPEAPDTAKPVLSYKPWACIAVILLGGLACLVLVMLKKRHYKNFIAVGVAVALLLFGVLLIDVYSPDDYYHGQSEAKPDAIGTVTLTVRCDRVPDLAHVDYLPDDGIILATETYRIAQGETVYDILTEAARKHGLHLDTTGVGESVYVRGINHLYEHDFGDLAGWTYYVNGTSPAQGCGSYTLSDGDEIVFDYSLTLGNQ